MNEFQCHHCKEKFIKGWSDEEAWIEFKAIPYYRPEDKIVILCDDCHIEFKKWVEGLTDEEHKMIREKDG